MYALKAQAIELMQIPYDDGSGQTLGPAFDCIAPEERHHARHDTITILGDGPYLVTGAIPLVRKRKLVSADGDNALTWHTLETVATEETYALCRCGQSRSKPFCDGTHARIGFDGTETADPTPSATHRRTLTGEEFVVRRDGPLCMHAAFCVGRQERIAAMMARTGDSDVRAHVMALIERCPSGSYTFALDDTSADVEPHLPTAIGVTEEEQGLAGALWVTGGVPIKRADDQPCETRNRVTLCRCGQSANKPFCDGTHRKIEFRE
jgi:CDGSH-type Zn-finger protein